MRAPGGLVASAFWVAALGIEPVRAQEPPPSPSQAADSVGTDVAAVAHRARIRVTGIAGSTIYISLEAPEIGEIAAGRALDVSRIPDGPVIGRLLVIERAGRRLLTRFEGEAFPVTRGTVLYLATEDGAGPIHPRDPFFRVRATDSDENPGPPGTPIRGVSNGLETRSSGSRRSDRVYGPRLSGLLSLESDLRRSTSSFTGRRDGTIDRTFATPGARVRATLSGLPVGLQIHTSLRGYNRDRQSRRPVQESQLQVFEAYALVSPRGSPVTLQGGRFLNRHEAFTGYWDGGLLRIGTPRFGVGAAVGWEPAVRGERLDQNLFKYGAFVGLETGSRATGYRLSLSAVRVDPRVPLVGSDPGAGPSAMRRTIVGASQRLTAGPVRLHANVEAEQDTAVSGWVISRAYLGATVRAGRVTVRGNASRLRGPVGVAFAPSLDPRRGSPRVGPPRDRVGAGVSLRIGSGSIGGDVTLSRDRLERTSHTFAGHLGMPRALPGDVGFGLNGFYWEDDRTNTVVSGFATLSRRFGRVRADVGYRFDRSERSGLGVVSHGLQIGFSVQGSTGWNYQMMGFARRGTDLETDRLYTRLSKSF